MLEWWNVADRDAGCRRQENKAAGRGQLAGGRARLTRRRGEEGRGQMTEDRKNCGLWIWRSIERGAWGMERGE